MRVTSCSLVALLFGLATIANAEVFSVAKPDAEATCDRFGTRIDFEPLDTAFDSAKEKSRLVVMFHLSGNFSKSAFT